MTSEKTSIKKENTIFSRECVGDDCLRTFEICFIIVLTDGSPERQDIIHTDNFMDFLKLAVDLCFVSQNNKQNLDVPKSSHLGSI